MREIERRIQVAERQSGESLIALPDRPIGVPENYDEHAKLMFDLAALAFQADITRVFTLLLGREQTNRAVSVHRRARGAPRHLAPPERSGEARQGAKINTYHIELLARFAEKLKATPDGDGTLLDNSMILQGSGLSNSRSALAHRPAAGPRRRRRRPAEGRASPAVPEGHADEQPAPRDAGEGRRAGREVRRQHRPDRSRPLAGV